MALLKKIFRFKKKDSPIFFEGYTASKSEYDDSYTTVKGVLKIAGLRLTRVDSPFVSKCWNAYYWFVFMNMAVVTVLELSYLARSISRKVYSDMFKMMPVIGYMFLSMTKSFNITYNRPIFENLISELRTMWPNGTVSKEEYDILKRGYKNFRPVHAVYYLTVFLSFVFSYPPIVIIIKSFFGLEASKMYLPYLYWLPFDPFQSLGVYTAMITVETWHCISTIWAMMAADLLLGIFLNHITIQLELLAVRIQKMIPVFEDFQLIKNYPLAKISKTLLDADRGLEENDLEEKRLKEIKDIATRHQTLIRLAKDVENMYTFALLVNFLNSSVIICFCGLCSVFIEKWYEVDYKSFLLSTMFQNWIVCWYGQKLIDSSVGISRALYNSGWYRGSRKIRSSVLIMMHRSQKEIHVTTFGFSVISLSTFTAIVKSSWSYFTLLINVMKQ